MSNNLTSTGEQASNTTTISDIINRLKSPASRRVKFIEVENELIRREENLNRIICNLREENWNLHTALEEALFRCDRAVEYSRLLESQEEALRRRFEEERAELTGNLSGLEIRLEEMEEELRLRDEVRRRNEAEKAEVMANLSGLKRKLEEMEAKLRRRNKMRRRYEAEFTENLSGLKRRLEEKEEVRRRHAEFGSDVVELRELSEKVEEDEELRRRNEAEKAELGSEEVEEMEMEGLEVDEVELGGDVVELGRKVSETVEKFKNILGEMEDEVDGLIWRKEGLEAEKAGDRGVVEKLNEKVELLEKKLREKEEEVEELRRRNEGLEAEKAEFGRDVVEKLSEKVEGLENKLREKEELRRLNEVLEAEKVKFGRDAVEKLSDKVKGLGRRLEWKEEEIKELMRRNEGLEVENVEFGRDVVDKLSEKVEGLERRLKGKDEEIEELRRRHESCLRRLEGEVKELRVRKDLSDKEGEKAEVEGIRRRDDVPEAEKTSFEGVVERMKEFVRRMAEVDCERIGLLEGYVAEVEGLRNGWREKDYVQYICEKRAEVQGDLKELEGEKAKLEASLDEMRVVNQEKENQIRELTEKLVKIAKEKDGETVEVEREKEVLKLENSKMLARLNKIESFLKLKEDDVVNLLRLDLDDNMKLSSSLIGKILSGILSKLVSDEADNNTGTTGKPEDGGGGGDGERVRGGELSTEQGGLRRETGGSSNIEACAPAPSRYDAQKRRDWNTFLEYLKNHKPALSLSHCSASHVIEFFKYLDRFGKTKVHLSGCQYFGDPKPTTQCACPLKQAWGSMDSMSGRLRAAYEENGGLPESNPFGARAVQIYLREMRDIQANARGVSFKKNKRKQPSTSYNTAAETVNAKVGGAGGLGDGGSRGIRQRLSYRMSMIQNGCLNLQQCSEESTRRGDYDTACNKKISSLPVSELDIDDDNN